MNNLEKYKNDLQSLLKTSDKMLKALYLNFDNLTESQKSSFTSDEIKIVSNNKGVFESSYQSWYSESIVLIKQLLPDRFEEFKSLYETNPKRKELNALTYSIQDWLIGIRSSFDNFRNKKHFDDLAITSMKFQNQVQILKSLQRRFESSLFDIKKLVQADLFDSEFEVAKELNRKGFHRAAGIIAGVIIERHLFQVCQMHNIKISKKNPTISDFNDALKNNNVIDVLIWRLIQHILDIRNLCGHNKDREPTRSEVEDLILTTEKVTKTVL